MSIMALVKAHPKAVAGGASAVVAVGMYGFGRRRGAGMKGDATKSPAVANSYEIPAGKGDGNLGSYTFNIPGYSAVPPASTPFPTTTKKGGGPLPAAYKRDYGCPKGFTGTWEPGNTGNVVCKEVGTGKLIPVVPLKKAG